MNVLVVSTQFPFPPRSGFAMRVYQLARQLASRHQVTLLSYARTEQQDGVTELRKELGVRVVEHDQRPDGAAKRADQLRSIASARPFYCRAFHSDEMQAAIDELCARRSIEVVQLESSLLCTFTFPPAVRVVLDEHNIEYEVYRRMCEGERSPARRSFNRFEYRRFRRFEERCWTRVDGCVVTSEREEPVVRSVAPHTPTAVVPNGVDLGYFVPSGARVQARTLAFNGILDYRPNLDAARHLVDHIWPRVLRHCPDARLTIVGRARPAAARSLRGPGVVLTGEVPDVRPYLQRAAVLAVPIRIGGGTRLKVLEGLAIGKPVVSTSLGCEGIAVRDGEHLLIADDPELFASSVVKLFDSAAARNALGRAGRKLIEREYSWDLAGERLEALYDRALAGPTRSVSNGHEPRLLRGAAGGSLFDHQR